MPVLKAIQEFEQLLNYDRLDIKFAVDTEGKVHIFQVRPKNKDRIGNSNSNFAPEYLTDRILSSHQ